MAHREETISEEDSNSQRSINGNRIGWFGNLILFAVLYGVIGSIGFITLESTRGYSLAISIPIVFASVMIIASWSVFGPAKFWVAFLLGQVTGMVIASACVIGFHTQYWKDFDGPWFATGLIATACFVPTVTVAAQIPLWIFRGLFGWRFTFQNELPTSSLSLRDLFFITFVFAIAATAPQYASSIVAATSAESIHIGSIAEVPQPPGGYSVTQVTASNIEGLRAVAREETRNEFYQMALTYSTMVIVVSLLTVPWTWFIFRIRNPAISGACCVAYGLVYYVILAVIFSVTNGWAFFFYQVSIWTLVVIICSLAGFTIPMAVARSGGYRLTTARNRKANH